MKYFRKASSLERHLAKLQQRQPPGAEPVVGYPIVASIQMREVLTLSQTGSGITCQHCPMTYPCQCAVLCPKGANCLAVTAAGTKIYHSPSAVEESVLGSAVSPPVAVFEVDGKTDKVSIMALSFFCARW